MIANLKCTVEQMSETYETRIRFNLALIVSTCRWSLQFELHITHANTPTELHLASRKSVSDIITSYRKHRVGGMALA